MNPENYDLFADILYAKKRNMCLMKYSLWIIHQSQTVVSVKIKDL